jgi:type I restriction enzyme S subunit
MSEVVTAWCNVKLGELCLRLVNGGTPSTANSKFWNGNIPWVTGADFTSKGIGEIRRYVSENGIRASSTSVVLPENLLVVTRTDVGKLAITKEPIAISLDITGVYPDPTKTDTLVSLIFAC